MTHSGSIATSHSQRRPIERRALALWPRLNPTALHRCGGDPRRIARLVSRRTSLSIDVIMGMLSIPFVTPQEVESWFG